MQNGWSYVRDYVYYKLSEKINLVTADVVALSPSIPHEDDQETLRERYVKTRILESSAGCRTMFLFAVFCEIGALERNAVDFMSN